MASDADRKWKPSGKHAPWCQNSELPPCWRTKSIQSAWSLGGQRRDWGGRKRGDGVTWAQTRNVYETCSCLASSLSRRLARIVELSTRPKPVQLTRKVVVNELADALIGLVGKVA